MTTSAAQDTYWRPGPQIPPLRPPPQVSAATKPPPLEPFYNQKTKTNTGRLQPQAARKLADGHAYTKNGEQRPQDARTRETQGNESKTTQPNFDSASSMCVPQRHYKSHARAVWSSQNWGTQPLRTAQVSNTQTRSERAHTKKEPAGRKAARSRNYHPS